MHHRTHHPAARPIPAPAGIYDSCDCGQEATPGHVCPRSPLPAPQPEPGPVPDPKALAALHRLETWGAHLLRDRQATETLRHELAAGGAA